MKSLKMIGMSIVLVAIVAGCDSKDEEYLKLQQDYLVLQDVMAAKDSVVNAFVLNLKTIEDNLVLVRSKQQMIESHAVAGAELAHDARSRIMQEIATIDALLTQNQDRIEAFREELRRSNIRTNSFRETINTLNGILIAREGQMDSLKMKLIEMNFEAEELASVISGLQDENANKDSVIHQQVGLMNEGYITIASARELMDRGVVRRSGGILGLGSTLVLSEDIDPGELNRIDIREAGGFSFNGRKASLVTTHPEASYTLIEDGDVSSIVINDREEFWSRSRMMVVATK